MKSYNVKLYWIRHGYSCANIIKDTIGNNISNEFLLRSKYAPDAQLSNYGINQVEKAAINNKELLKDITLVLTSELRRAIETSLVMFKGYNIKIYPIPYINEERNDILKYLNFDKDNDSMGIENLQEYLKDNYPVDYNKLDFKLLKELKLNNNEIFTADINKFYQLVIPKVIHIINKNNINIAIISHNKFMENYLKNYNDIDYIKNTDIYVENMEIILNDDKFVNKISKSVNECGNKLTCKVSTDLNEIGELNKDSYQRCNENMKNILGDIRYIPKGFKTQNGGDYYMKYMLMKFKYLQLKEKSQFK